MDKKPDEILQIVTSITVWGICGLLGLTILILVGQVLLAFASTGIGAIVLIIIGWRWYKKYKENNNYQRS